MHEKGEMRKTQQKRNEDKNEYGQSPFPLKTERKKMPANIQRTPRQSGKLHLPPCEKTVV
jgi:hypothetical protein